MSRGLSQQCNVPLSLSINDDRNDNDTTTSNYAYKLLENQSSNQSPSLPSIKCINIYDHLIEQTNIERNIFISNELCENPISLSYNPNKSNSIRCENSGRENKVDRSRNNVASRLSRFKRKREFQLSKITCEYFEEANDALEIELKEMASQIREKENLLAQKLNSNELVEQLRNNCGLESDF